MYLRRSNGIVETRFVDLYDAILCMFANRQKPTNLESCSRVEDMFPAHGLEALNVKLIQVSDGGFSNVRPLMIPEGRQSRKSVGLRS
jgi:hypothetical protein